MALFLILYSLDVEGAKALFTSATNPSSPPTVIRHTSLEPFRRTLSQHTVDSHTVLVESLQAYKRQLSSVTTISNDSNTSMASLTSLASLASLGMSGWPAWQAFHGQPGG